MWQTQFQQTIPKITISMVYKPSPVMLGLSFSGKKAAAPPQSPRPCRRSFLAASLSTAPATAGHGRSRLSRRTLGRPGPRLGPRLQDVAEAIKGLWRTGAACGGLAFSKSHESDTKSTDRPWKTDKADVA